MGFFFSPHWLNISITTPWEFIMCLCIEKIAASLKLIICSFNTIDWMRRKVGAFPACTGCFLKKKTKIDSIKAFGSLGMGCCTWLLVREYLINDQSVCARLTVKQLVFITSNNPTCTISPEHGSMFLMSRYQGLASEATADVWYWSCLMGQISCRLASRSISFLSWLICQNQVLFRVGNSAVLDFTAV